MATFNPFNPDGSWNWQNVSIDEEAAKTTRQAADAWAKAGKKAEEPWNQWQSQKSPEELNAFNQWKRAYVKFNDMTTKPGENWFRQEWDCNEVHAWAEEQHDEYASKMDYEERLAFRAFCEATDYEYRAQEWYAWCNAGSAEWWANKSRPDAWKELLKQAERNRQQQKQESYWDRQGRAHYGKAWDDFFNKQQSKRELTEELARALILSNLDKFDVHYAEYWQRQRRMQMNEAKSKIGQLSIVHMPTVQERFRNMLAKSAPADIKSKELTDFYYRVYPQDLEAGEIATTNMFVSRLMSPLFQWNQ